MMAEGRNNGKPKRPHSYRPYDSANSSIVSRITNRVSGILPQPSSWLGKWLSPAEQQHFRSESEDDDLARQQPPLKRFCLHPSTDGPTHQNHVRRTVAREPELSPILRDRSDQPDGVIAGPSGLHLRGANFVASTPAVSAAEPKANGPVRVNGDEGSDGSESTSGCSSLVPQGERSSNAPFPEITPKASPETPKLSHTPDSLGGRTLTLKPKNRTMDLSYSFSKSRPSFDAYAFNNPLNKSSSFNSSFNRTMDDSTASPFYRGRTMYGGSSSCKESLSLSLMSPKVGTPRIVSVKPTVTPRQNRDISTSALKILRALEQFSTPVLEAKKIPVVNDSERRKRKAVQPFEDLVIPTVPDLLRIKRKKVTSESGGISAASSAASTPKPYQLPPPVQPLSVRDDVAEPKRVVKGKDELSTETAEKVDLPTVPLPITTLPSFNLSSLPRSCSTYTLTNSTSASAAPLPSKISSVPSPTISSFKFTAAPGATATASVGKLKFSEPSFEASVPAQITSIKPALQFREPLDAAKSESPKPTTTLAQSPKKPSPELNFIANSSTFQPKLKTASTSKAVKSEIDNSSSIADFFKKDNISSKNDKSESGEQVSKSLSEQFKPKTGSWTCEACLVPNPSDSTKCCCCETPKKGPDQPKQAPQPPEQTWSCNKCSFKNKQSADVCVCGLKKGEKSTIAPLSAKPSADTWECNVCLVRNKCSETACVACNSPKPGVAPSAKPAAPSLLTAFKKPEGSWECSVCMVNNKAADNACVACTSPKPGAEKEKPKPSFSFGIPPAAAPAPAAVPGGFSFGATSVKSDAPSGFTFGIPKTEKNEEEKKTEVSNLFSFGSAATTQKKDPTPDVVTLDTPDDKKDRPPKKSVSFGEPLVAEKSTTEPPKTSAPTTATFSFEAAKTESSTFPPPTRSIFGATSVVASSSTDAKTTAELPFKLGNSGSSGVSSSTDSATSSVIPTTTASSGFNVFGSGTKSTSIFPTASTNNLFPSSSAEPKASTFSFGAVKSDAPKVDASSTNLFSGQKDQKTGLFGMPAPSEAKASGFFNSTEAKPVFGAENKPVFGSAGNKPTFGSVESKIVFEGSAPENTPAFGAETKPAFGGDSNNVFGGVKANFVSTSNSLFEMKPATTVGNAGFNAAPTVFGSATPINNAEKPLFGSLPSGPSSTPFVFKASEPKVGGFSFTPSAPSVAPTNAFGFNAEPPKFGNAEPPKFGNAVGGLTAPQSSNVFGTPAAATPLFNNPTPAPTPSLFTFGAPQPEQQQPQQPAPLFGFSAPQQQAVTTPFGFNVNNTPAQPPTFDPNQKPTFNFTGGSTPNFAAPPSTSTEPKPDRKIRRAVRRTQPR